MYENILKLLVEDPEKIDHLKKEDFKYNNQAFLLFEEIENLFLNGKAISFNTLGEIVPTKLQGYLETIKISPASDGEFETLVDLLKQDKKRKDYHHFGQQILRMKDSNLEDITSYIADKSIELLTDSNEELVKLHEGLKEIDIDSLQKARNLVGYPTSLPTLDSLTLGFEDGTLNFIAGRPSTGKSQLARQIAMLNISEGNPVVPFSIEETRGMYLNKLISCYTGIDLNKIRKRTLTNQDIEKVKKFVEVSKDLPLYIVDVPVNLSAIYAKTRQVARLTGKQPLVIVDYVQLMAKEEDNKEISRISRGLKLIAMRLNVPVLGISQLSRAGESREEPMPKLSDLRGSGAIEQNSDTISFLTLSETERLKPAVSKTKLFLLKNREGETGKINLKNHKRIQKFEEETQGDLT